jgi:hypothetical protein
MMELTLGDFFGNLDDSVIQELAAASSAGNLPILIPDNLCLDSFHHSCRNLHHPRYLLRRKQKLNSIE